MIKGRKQMIKTNRKNNNMIFTVTIRAENERRLGRQELIQLEEELQDAVLNVILFKGGKRTDLYSPSISDYRFMKGKV